MAPPSFFAYLRGRSGTQAIAALDEIGRRYLKRARKSVPKALQLCSLALVFRDLSKAFDKVSREAVWETLVQLLPGSLGVTLEFKSLYDGAEYCLTGPGGEPMRYLIPHGVRQGAVEGPLLFIIVYTSVLLPMRTEREVILHWITLVLRLPDFEELKRRTVSNNSAHALSKEYELIDISDLFYADDTVTFVLYTSLAQISLMLSIWARLLGSVRLPINWEKTEVMLLWRSRTEAKRWAKAVAIKVFHENEGVMRNMESEDVVVWSKSGKKKSAKDKKQKANNNKAKPENVVPKCFRAEGASSSNDVNKLEADRMETNELPFKEVRISNMFKYLGVLFVVSWSAGSEVAARVRAAQAIFTRLTRRVLRSSVLPRLLKLRLYSSLVFSVLSYGNPGGVLTKADEKRIESFHLKCVRNILEEPTFMTRVSHEQLLQKHGVFTANSQLRKLRLQLVRPTLKGYDGRVLKAVFWAPMPWEPQHGGIVTGRLAQLERDVLALSKANNVSLPEDRDQAFVVALEFLLNSSPKQLEKVLSHICEHLRGDKETVGPEVETITCPECEKQCKGVNGLRIHRIQSHNWVDPRRAQVTLSTCAACLTTFFQQAKPVQYCKHHFQHRRCIEAKVEELSGFIAYAENGNAEQDEELRE